MNEIKYIEYPIEVNKIEREEKLPFKDTFSFSMTKVGSLVRIRPCAEEYKDKTFLGLYIGDIPLGNFISYKPDEKILTIQNGMDNPAIFVFELNKVILGCESFWAEIKSEEEMNKLITDEMIQNIWYIKMLKDLSKKIEGEFDETDNC